MPLSDDDRYLAAVREECSDLSREQLLRRIAALSRRLDTETAQHYGMRRAYDQLSREEHGS